MHRTLRQSAAALALGLSTLLPAAALAGVGKVSVLEGRATRTSGDGVKAPLAVGTDIELKDTLDVGPKSNLKLTLTDGSVIMLGESSQLVITEGDFAGQERKGFSARLGFGKFWSSVTKALSGNQAKFEVSTDRAVAGVRGTIFRVDAVKVVGGTTQAARRARTIVRVVEGRVAVEAQVKKQQPTSFANRPGGDGRGAPARGPRKQVSGPTQISAEEWEKRFVELQANQQVTVGEELWQEAAIDAGAKTDAFAKFVEQHQ